MARCSVEGCNRQAKSLGYCGAHYQRFKKGKPLDDPPLRQECSIRGCRRVHHRDTFCDPHYAQCREVLKALNEAGDETVDPPPGLVMSDIPAKGRSAIRRSAASKRP